MGAPVILTLDCDWWIARLCKLVFQQATAYGAGTTPSNWGNLGERTKLDGCRKELGIDFAAGASTFPGTARRGDPDWSARGWVG